MTRNEQEQYLKILGADVYAVSNKKDMELLLAELLKTSNGRISLSDHERIKNTLLIITDAKVLKKAYKKKAKECHPDLGGSEDEFKKVNHAYNMLVSPSYCFQDEKNGRRGPINLDAKVQVYFSFEQAFFGDSFTVSVNPTAYDEDGNILSSFDKDSEADLPVSVFYLRIPEGTPSGTLKTIPKKGMTCGVRVGDLVLTYVVHPHPKFTMVNTSIVSLETIPLDIMLTGGKIEVLTMWGMKELVVPPGTQPNTVLCLPGCGVAKLGVHEVTVLPKYPQKEDLKKKSVWQKLDIKWGKKAGKDTNQDHTSENQA